VADEFLILREDEEP